MESVCLDEFVGGAESIVGIVKLLVNNPGDVIVNVKKSEYNVTIELHTNPKDVGQVLGRSGHIKDSIRSLLAAFGGKNGTKVHFDYITEWQNNQKRNVGKYGSKRRAG